MNNVTNYIRISSNQNLKMSPDGDFFRTWVDFTKPIHNLTPKEMEVLALYLKERYELSKKIPNDAEMVDKILMSKDVRDRVRKQCNIKARHLNVVLSKFRKNGVIRDNRIYLNLIPILNEEGAGLYIEFDFKNEQRIKLGPQAGGQKAQR